MKKRKIWFIALLSYLLITAFMFVFFQSHFNERRLNYLREEQENFSLEYYSALQSFRRTFDIIFEHNVNNPEVLGILQSFENSQLDSLKNIYRRQLFVKLNGLYLTLKRHGIRQFHFHTPQNRSLLRFHRPQKFGDDLTSIRSSVRQANEKLKIISGFEEGRIFNGFRNVYPIVFNGQHLGSVELSVSLASLREELKKSNPNNQYELILKREVIESKVFKSERSNYKQCQFHPDLFVESKEVDAIKKIPVIPEKYHDEIRKMYDSLTPFSLLIEEDPGGVLVFHPLKNLEKKHVGYIVSYNPKTVYASTFLKEFIWILVFMVMGNFLLIFFATKLYLKHQTLKISSITDPLTTLPNRRALVERLEYEFVRSRRDHSPLCVMMVDIDFFKKINDTLGHAIGDQALKKVALEISHTLNRQTDFAARYGGEEFVGVLPMTDLEGAYGVAEIIRKKINGVTIKNKVLSVSIGVAERCDKTNDWEELIKAADEALYLAKESGRNQVVIYSNTAEHSLEDEPK